VEVNGSHLETQRCLLTPVVHARMLGDLQVEKKKIKGKNKIEREGE
jgi:hypothetical protein